MFAWGTKSNENIDQCDVRWRSILDRAMSYQIIDLYALCGHRNEAEQNLAFALKRSKLQWPKSKHNTLPSIAVDVCPYPVRWGDKDDPERAKAIGAFYLMAGLILAAAHELGHEVRWGGDWDMDGDIYDQDFDDLVHFELVT